MADRGIRLRNLTAEDPTWLATALESWPHTERFSQNGRSVTPERLQHVLSSDVEAQAVAESSVGPIGLLQLSPPQPVTRTVVLSIIWHPREVGLGEALDVFLAPATAALDLRKVWLTCSETCTHIIDAVSSRFAQVGRLVDHTPVKRGEYDDALVFERFMTGPPPDARGEAGTRG
jgi:hypothetical protein